MPRIKKVDSKELLTFNQNKFYINTNGLIDFSTVKTVLDKFEKNAIEKLNEFVSGLNFLIGNNSTAGRKKGVARFSTFEFDFKTGVLTFYLSKIFNSGVDNWIRIPGGSLKRYLWESLFFEIIFAVIKIAKINPILFERAKKCDLYARNVKTKQLLHELFNYSASEATKINYFEMHMNLWIAPLPALGFLEVLYNAKVKELNSPTFVQILNINKVKVLNEMRRIKLNYEYEYNLSELINYIISKDQFKILYKNDLSSKSELYSKVRRIVLSYIQKNRINLKPYYDSSNRTHYFLTHNNFESIKVPCILLCQESFNNEYLLEYNKFKEYFIKCPICKTKGFNENICELIYYSKEYIRSKDELLGMMKNHKSPEEFNDKDYYFGVPCEDCFHITKSIRGKFDDLQQIQKFLLTYKYCPICSAKNHIDYLTSIYYDNSKKEMRKFLINILAVKNKTSIKVGIPCCLCYKNIFSEDPHRIGCVENIAQ